MKQKFILTTAVIILAFSIASNAIAQWVQVGLSNRSITAFLVSGTNLFAGSDSGIFLSTDTGENWIAKSRGLPFGSISSDSGYCEIASFVIIGDNLFAGIDNINGGGVFRSTDNGNSWNSTNGLIDNRDVYALATIEANLFAATGDAVFLSTNNGSSWKAVDSGLTGNSADIYSLAIVDSNLFSGFGYIGDGGVSLSTDNGASWKAAGDSDSLMAPVNAFAVSGTNLFAGAGNDEVFVGGVYLSTDNGASWMGGSYNSPNLIGDVTSLAVSGSNVFAGVYAGILYGSGVFLSKSNNIDSNWSQVNAGLTDSTIFSLAVFGSYLFAGTDSGVWRRPLSDFGISSVAQTPTTPTPQIQIYPNPFTQSTEITFTTQAAGYAQVSIVNMLGVEVAHLFSGKLGAGEHAFLWGKPTGLPELPDGTYECLVRMNGQVQSLPVVKF